ncbi:fungal specific transcription factor domain-containing protein [Aspergillus candidus]|uniref:Fungal-specific transcription factor domain-domain-containing protein n=1 Tax=Aspergillus candidus TaxID=41067 RepID=A0A2I2FF93_ASPCN|nr:fungal-specific transcription factor domain-domain-containing protein [Aspergillus candidus]PLB39303.1 fungal-specific transcription factor domain-domain-containing protein [Aspergillus candidus]
MSFSTKHTLLSLYFDHIQPIFPMFRRPALYHGLLNSHVPDDLLVAMFAIACRFLPPEKCSLFFGHATAPWEQFSRLAHQKSRENADKEGNRPVTLDAVKTACLLALYEYTSTPSRQAWVLVGNAMRLALMAQLHQVDCANGPDNLSAAEKEERRFVWWTIWRLDCTINVTTVTPFSIDPRLIGTALVSTTIPDFTAGVVDATRNKISEMDPVRSWTSVQGPQVQDTGDGFNTHLFAVSLLRAVSECHQRLNTRVNAEDIQYISSLEEIFTALDVIFPGSFFAPAKSPTEESHTHRLRLETIIMLNTARLILNEPVGQLTTKVPDNPSNSLVSLGGWRDSLGYAEDIANVFNYWPSDYFAVSDPIISCAIWHAYCGLMMLEMSGLKNSGADLPNMPETNALEGLSVSLNSFTPWWPIARVLQDSLQELRAWSWAKLDSRRLIGLISHVRKAFSPFTRQPGRVDVSILCDSLVEDLTMSVM